MNSAGYGSGRQGEAPACVQNAMMTKDKKPFTYTPGGIDLSQIKSERMAKRLQRNAQAEGATGASQQNRPAQPQSPNSGNAAATMGAAAMGMPFQVLPPPPPPQAMMGKNGSAPAPPPPPPTLSTLAPPTNASSAPGSPNAARKSPTPQRFEPPPMGFRPEIKIPANPMASLRKVPPPVEKNNFWKDEYVKEKSPMVGDANDSGTTTTSMPNNNGNSYNNVDATINNNNYNNNDDGLKKSMPTPTTKPETNNYNQHNSPQQSIQQPQYNTPTPPPSTTIPITPPQQYRQQQQQQQQQQQKEYSPRPEFRSVAPPQSPAVNVYTRQTDSPRATDASSSGTATPPPRATESPFKFAQQQQHLQQQQRMPPAISPLAQQSSPAHQSITTTPSSTSSSPMTSQQPQGQSVPWRTQRGQTAAAPPIQQQQQTPPQAIYNNVQPTAQQQQMPYQGPKPTNVGSLYIAPLAPTIEPQAQNIVRQQLQQQQQQRDSPMRQMPPQQQDSQMRQPARWMTTQPAPKEQPEWARPEENGNIVPSTLHRIKSPPPPQQQQQQPQQQYQPTYQTQYPTHAQGNGYANTASGQNFGAQPTSVPAHSTGLRLLINTTTNNSNSNGPKERIIPIQLEQTPTYAAAQPNFNAGSAAPAGYVIRSPNQFVDQGYNNYPATHQSQQQQQQQQQMRGASAQRVMSPTQQLNSPRMIQQQQLQTQQQPGNKTRIIPIALETAEGTRGPISQSPIVIQNDQRTPPIQSKSFRILQKITDTTDDGTSNGTTPNSYNTSNKNDNYVDAEPQLQRPQFARQMSAQQARHSPTVEQMRRMQITHDQQQQQQQQNTQAWNQTDTPQQYIHPSEQHVPEPKKYTGSAIPSRSFKILQAMTTPENAGPGQSDL